MILRRITEHVKAQNWFAVGLDFVIVVIVWVSRCLASNGSAIASNAPKWPRQRPHYRRLFFLIT